MRKDTSPSEPRRLGRGGILLIAVLLAMLAVTGWLMLDLWIGLGEVEISPLGLLAMVGGLLLCLALGVGLMALTFYSARRGYDERGRGDLSD